MASLNPLEMLSVHGLGSHGAHSAETATIDVYNALTGAQITAPLTLFGGIEALKLYLSQHFKIDVDSLFLLTAYGVKLKFAMLINNETRTVYAFDRKYFSPAVVTGEDKQLRTLLAPLADHTPIAMIRPRECPILSAHLDVWINDLSHKLDGIVNSADLDFDALRATLNILKRTSGWASALVSDFKSSIFKSSNDAQADVGNILESLNVLNQYVNQLFGKLERDFNENINDFDALASNSLAEAWHVHYKLLRQLSFATNDNGRRMEICLAELIDENEMARESQKAKELQETLRETFANVRDLFSESVTSQLEFSRQKYEEYKARYLSSQRRNSSNDLTNKCRELFEDLELQGAQMDAEIKTLASFPELIVTTSPSTTQIAPEAVEKIKVLVQVYQKQVSNRVPCIVSLVEELYATQVSGLYDKSELQRDIVTSFFVAIVKVQLSIRKLTKMIHKDITRPLTLLRETELSLSVVSDLPLLLGIWAIALLGNLKHGMSIDRLVRKTGEVLEMLTYVENKSQAKWLDDFISGVGSDKAHLLGLGDLELRVRFAKGLFNGSEFKVESKRTAPNFRLGDVSMLQVDKRLSFEHHYLQPLNKIIQGINFGQHEETPVPKPIVQKQSRPQLFFETMARSVTLADILRYIRDLQNAGGKAEIVTQLNHYVRSLGVVSLETNATLNESGEIVIRKGDLNGFGTFDATDGMFFKVFRKFLKGFEIEGVTIEVTTASVQETADETREGYEIRIKKLENLLHERRFETFNNKWTKFSQNNPTMYLPLGPSIDLANVRGVTLGEHVDLPPSHYGEKLSRLSLENEQMAKELAEMREGVKAKLSEALAEELEFKDRELAQLRNELKLVKAESQAKDQLIANQSSRLETLEAELLSYKSTTNNTQEELNGLRDINRDLIANMSHKEADFLRENELNQKEKNELKHQVDDLHDHTVILRQRNEKSVEELKRLAGVLGRVPRLVDLLVCSSRDLSGIVLESLRTICLVLESMGLIVEKAQGRPVVDSGDSVLDQTVEYAGETEAFHFGPGDELTVRRVKGLRSRKKEMLVAKANDGAPLDMGQVIHQVVAGDIIAECERRSNWVPWGVALEMIDFGVELVDSFEEISSSNGSGKGGVSARSTEEMFQTVREKCDEISKWLERFDVEGIEAKFGEFRELAGVREEIVVERAHRRFDDVESLARKLTKEKNTLKVEVKELRATLKNRLVLRNFAVGDLVLFLKAVVPGGRRMRTPIVDSDASYSLENSQDIGGVESIPSSTGNLGGEELRQSWAIFNMGSPNYYLKRGKGGLRCRDWFVARIAKLEEHTVTEDTRHSGKKNPFGLEVGEKWFYVITEDEKATNVMTAAPSMGKARQDEGN